MCSETCLLWMTQCQLFWARVKKDLSKDIHWQITGVETPCQDNLTLNPHFILWGMLVVVL